jgi:protein-tyrosine phosphatase
MNLVLFLCTGNYYRSRFTEHLFDHWASQISLNWRALSRGIATDLGIGNVGPISIHAVQGLESLGIELEKEIPFPLQLQEEDLARADLIIALNVIEHRPLLKRRFPGWANQVEYWEIPDLDVLSAEEALPRMAQAVQTLIQRLINVQISVPLMPKILGEHCPIRAKCFQVCLQHHKSTTTIGERLCSTMLSEHSAALFNENSQKEETCHESK